ncbi:MAG: transcriptional repressor [Lentimicrobiaceae bacterium]|jgi:Fur family ferric uptake transcriptional regulator|nr:transcriptional repressor [Lentimicrobiaceae bacterium]
MKPTDKMTFEAVKKLFTEYLTQHGHRKTPERFTILKEIYSTDGHFDIETLYIRMKNSKYMVSRATLYNTIELLLNCKLVIKHQFGHSGSQFERSYKFSQHDHILCLDTGKLLEFCDPRIQEIQESVSKMFNMNITHHSLTFYGTCNEKKEEILTEKK